MTNGQSNIFKKKQHSDKGVSDFSDLKSALKFQSKKPNSKESMFPLTKQKKTVLKSENHEMSRTEQNPFDLPDFGLSIIPQKQESEPFASGISFVGNQATESNIISSTILNKGFYQSDLGEISEEDSQISNSTISEDIRKQDNFLSPSVVNWNTFKKK